MRLYAFWPSPLRSAKGALKRIIITGDDFGLALPVNKAIEEAHLKGILTTASLMVGAKFAGDAAERARKHPSLKVGLHLTLVEGISVLPPQRIPDLVDASGSFPTHLTRAGFKFFFYPGIRKQLEAEIRAQFDAFYKTGSRAGSRQCAQPYAPASDGAATDIESRQGLWTEGDPAAQRTAFAILAGGKNVARIEIRIVDISFPVATSHEGNDAPGERAP